MTALLFDIDGTLVRTGGAGKAAMDRGLRDAFGLTEINDTVPYSGRTDVAIGRDLLTIHGLDPSVENLGRLHAAYLAALPGCLARLGGTVLPGVREVIATLQTRENVLLGLLTGNLRNGAERKLAHFGLWDAFAVGGFGDDHSDRDDVARTALFAVGAYRNEPPTDVWVIGDTPLDVKCARAIGAKVLAVATGWHPIEELTAVGADVVLQDLSDHAGVVRLLTDV